MNTIFFDVEVYMNEIIKAILERRTCRSFTQEAVTLDQVKTILDCALAAPSGMCKQTWKFTAVVNPEKIQRLAAAVGSALNRGPEYTMYSPQVLVITSNLKESKYREVDNACAMENIYLACQGLGLGCVWINQVQDCQDAPEVRAILSEFGIPAEHGVYGCAAIGYRASPPVAKEVKGQWAIVE